MVYVAGDLNGCLNDWKKLICEIDLKSTDMVFLTGDVIGGDEDPIALLFDLMTRTNVFPLMGYKEFRFSECISKIAPDADKTNFYKGLDENTMDALAEFLKSGGRTVFEQYMELSPEEQESVREYLEEFTLYEELTVKDRNFVLTHSGLSDFDKNKEPGDYRLFDYLLSSHEPGEKLYDDRILVFGHTPTFEFGKKYTGRIIKTDSFINVDCGAMYRDKGGRLGCVRLDDLEEFYV
ncbi:MAG: hypothetical protein IKD89_07945 [Clostridia bacterium]|nr:hypothetical protein [Clostridia bacterium]